MMQCRRTTEELQTGLAKIYLSVLGENKSIIKKAGNVTYSAVMKQPSEVTSRAGWRLVSEETFLSLGAMGHQWWLWRDCGHVTTTTTTTTPQLK